MKRYVPEIVVVLVALAAFLPGVGWGLPTRAADAGLFGDREPWTGEQIVALAGGFDAASERGADVDANPLTEREGVVLNATDAQRAEIVRRYRLMSRQPDEFINFAAIAGMASRRDGDPRLYQYGGVWLYGVATLLGLAKLTGLATVTGDLTHYLDAPADLGRFYVVARLYSVAFGVAAAVAVVRLTRRLSTPGVAAVAGATFCLLPVVIVAAHEAKPHLGGLAFTLWAVVAASRFSETRTLGSLLLTGALLGLAMGMVVNAVLAIGVALSVAAPLRGAGRSADGPDQEREPVRYLRHHAVVRLLATVLIAGLVYVVTNPYVVINALTAPGLLTSNLGNSTAMYGVALSAGDALRVLLDGGGRLMLLGLAGAIVVPGLAVAKRRTKPVAWHLAAVALPAAVVFVLLAAGKPAEYARFGLLPITGLAVAAVLLMAKVGDTMRRKKLRGGAAWLAVPPLLAALPGVATWLTFQADDARAEPLLVSGTLHVPFEPAPWSMPPADLWETRLVLGEGQPRLEMRDVPGAAVSWAAKGFTVDDGGE